MNQMSCFAYGVIWQLCQLKGDEMNDAIHKEIDEIEDAVNDTLMIEAHTGDRVQWLLLLKTEDNNVFWLTGNESGYREALGFIDGYLEANNLKDEDVHYMVIRPIGGKW